MSELKNRLRNLGETKVYIADPKEMPEIKPQLDKDDSLYIMNEEGEMDEDYNIYAVCTDSIAKTAGTSERSEWSEEATERYERCIKKLKGEKGYKLGEADETGVEGRDMLKLKKDVENLFNKLDFGPIKMALGRINTPIEQYEVISKFAEMIGVPRARLPRLITDLKDVAQTTESINPRMSKGKLLEEIGKVKNK